MFSTGPSRVPEFEHREKKGKGNEFGGFREQGEKRMVSAFYGWSQLPPLGRRTAPPTVRTPVRVALAGRTGPLTLGLEAPALEAAQDPRNLRVPPLQTSAPAALGP